MRDTAPGQRR